jgi:hypothetical protein
MSKLWISIFFVFGTYNTFIKGEAPSEWQRTDFIWNFGLRSLCDVGVDDLPEVYFKDWEYPYKKENYASIQNGSLVWLRPSFLKSFYRDYLKNLDKKIVIVISDGDQSFPKDCGLNPTEVENFLNHPCIQHVFTQNFDYKGQSKKVTPIPIGIDFHTVAFRGGYWGDQGAPHNQETYLKNLIAEAPPTRSRKIRAFVDFQHSESMRGSFQRYKEFGEDRTAIFQKIRNSGVVDFGSKMPRPLLWKTKTAYAFSISPWGNGLDCHRTWEDLALGCILIVKTSSLDRLYDGLPVVIVKDWNEITEENLQRWFELYKDASENSLYREKITNQYWFKKIMSAKSL